MISDAAANSLPIKIPILHQDGDETYTYKCSGFVIQKFGISLKSIPNFRNLSLVYSITDNKCLLHSKNILHLSHKVPRLIQTKQFKKLISDTKSRLEFIQSLSFIKNRLEKVCHQADEIINEYNTDGHQLSTSLKLKCILELLDQCFDFFEKLPSIQYKDVLFKRPNISTCAHHTCSVIIVLCNIIAKKLIHIRSLGFSETLSNIIYKCHVLKNDISAFDNSLLGLSPVFNVKLKRPLNVVNSFTISNVFHMSNDASASLMWYIAESAKERSKIITRLIVDASLPLTHSINNESKSKVNVDDKFVLFSERNENLKRVCKEVAKKLKKMVAAEINLFKMFLQEILGVNTSQITRKHYRHVTQFRNPHQFFKSIHWETSMGPVQKEYMFDFYIKTLWYHVKEYIAGVYIFVCLDKTSKSLSALVGKHVNMESGECMSDYVGKIDIGDNLPNQLLEVFSLFAYSVDVINQLKQWDKGMCRAMAAFLKDRFRANDTSEAGSPTINCMLTNHVCLTELIRVLKSKDGLVNETDIFHAVHMQTCILQPFVSSFNFLNFCLHMKRQQFLASAAWQPFFMVISADISEIYEQDVNDLNLIFHVENEVPMLNYFNDILEDWKTFKTNSVYKMAQVIKNRSRDIWKHHMPEKKVWRRRGSNIQAYKASSYTTVALQSILAPIVDSLDCVSRAYGLHIICKCFDAFIRSWMNHILGQKIIFSRYGAKQLSFDFMKFLQWFEEDAFDFTNEEISEIQSQPVIYEMQNVIVLLACQPEPRKSVPRENSLLNSTANYGSSASAISQVSLDSLSDGSFDAVLQSIDIRDKDRWLALRAKGGQAKRQFLCIG